MYPPLVKDFDAIDTVVAKYGEQYRDICTKAIHWLRTTEPGWRLTEPVDPIGYLEDVLSRVAPLP